MITIPDDGILLIDKPSGMTSFGVVARLRRVLSRQLGKKAKVGHTGTLDPFATGLMILVTGKACKEAMYYTKLDKIYTATFILGKNSTTGDPEGELISVSSKKPSKQELSGALKEFVGTIKQRPPIFSAIKVNGVRAYELARKGKEIEIPLREVEVYSLELIEYSYPKVTVRVHVSSGTYIRSLAVDLGKKIGTGAYCLSLRRESIDKWCVKDAQRLEDFGITS